MNQTITFSTSERDTLKNTILVFAGSFLLALLSKLSIPLFFTPIPLVFQNNAVLFLAFLMGKRGFLSTLLFFSYGLGGFSVFTNGVTGLALITGPTGGYIIGYLIAAYLVAYISDNLKKKTPLKAFTVMSLGSFVIMALGCFHLSFLIGIKNAILLGVVPFIFTNIMKTLMAVQIFRWTSK
jgi:biotin transport system substrate-specific component